MPTAPLAGAPDRGPGAYRWVAWIPAIALLFSFVYARFLLPKTGLAAAATAAIFFLLSAALSLIIGTVGLWMRARGRADRPAGSLLLIAWVPTFVVLGLILWAWLRI